MELPKTHASLLVAAAQRCLPALPANNPSTHALFRCHVCESFLHRPTTLGDGRTVCLDCVESVAGDDVQWGKAIDFGAAVNKTLEDLILKCLPGDHAAAQLRHEANACFAKGAFQEADQRFTHALETGGSDCVLLCGRSATRCQLGRVDEALSDARAACTLCVPGSRSWARACHHLGVALSRSAQQKLVAAGPGEAPPAVATFLTNAVVLLATALAWYRREGVNHPAIRDLVEALELARGVADREGPSEADVTALLETGPVALDVLKAQCASVALPTPPSDLSKSAIAADRESLNCPVCYSIFHEPTATPCGHLLCRPCLARALDLAFDQPARCPLCREDLGRFLHWLSTRARQARLDRGRLSHTARQLKPCTDLVRLLEICLPADVAERAAQAAHEESAAGSPAPGLPYATVPIFICALALPSIPFPLHVFEPRYRLMMRRCIDSGRGVFGMVHSPEAEYGTILEIDEFEQLPDGRSRLLTSGTLRFRVVAWGSKDGYATAAVEWIEDDVPSDEERVALETEARSLRELLTLLVETLPQRTQFEIMAQLGTLPSDPVALGFWGAALLWTGDEAQVLDFTFRDDKLRTSAIARLRAVAAEFRRRGAGLPVPAEAGAELAQAGAEEPPGVLPGPPAALDGTQA